jgi:cell division protein ZapA
MGCEDGEEARLVDLARDLDARIGKLRTKFGEIGDSRLTVMAALTLADELSEMNARMRKLEADLTTAQDATKAAADHHKVAQAGAAAALARAAERIESVTRKLNHTAGGNSVALG